ncbi:RNA polymerase sigma factor [Capsulimonas corticalis]|uniref:RNA polymerase sigma factor n=1 Tax=Capsulimonas corticalis TaxID=2219043 RepID=A0A402D2C0_9BACT|nr:RNA polymerase sigma factor [Capsulimonas corticalis]
MAERAARGERAACAEILDRYGARLHRLARTYAAGEADAEDLTQEIFVSLFKSIGGYGGRASLSTWIYRVALNQCLKHKERRAPDTLAYDETLPNGPDHPGDPERWVARRELADQVQSALGTLTPQHRDIVELHEMHGLTYSECAEILGVPLGTVKSRLSNAFRRLRDCLGGYVQDTASSAIPETASESLS